MVLYGSSRETACAVAELMIGQTCEEFAELAQSAITELANRITGKAEVLLEEAEVGADISPPALIMGSGASISTVDLRRLIVPLTTECDPLSIHVALEQTASQRRCGAERSAPGC